MTNPNPDPNPDPSNAPIEELVEDFNSAPVEQELKNLLEEERSAGGSSDEDV